MYKYWYIIKSIFIYFYGQYNEEKMEEYVELHEK